MKTRSLKLLLGLVAAALAGALGFHLTSARGPAGLPVARAEGSPGSATGDRGTPPPVAASSRTPSTSPGGASEDELADDVPGPDDPMARPPRYFPRAPEEWQGMRVELSRQALCDGPASCGLAMACKQQQCGPCVADAECAQGEACVLDHCVKQAQVACRHASDCGGDALCVLSGYSPGVRGNGEMRAYCEAAHGGEPDSDTPKPAEVTIPAPPPPYETAELLHDVDDDAKK